MLFGILFSNYSGTRGRPQLAQIISTSISDGPSKVETDRHLESSRGVSSYGLSEKWRGNHTNIGVEVRVIQDVEAL